MIPYPHRSGLRCNVSGKNTCRGYALEYGDTRNALLDCSSGAEGKVEVWDQSFVKASS